MCLAGCLVETSTSPPPTILHTLQRGPAVLRLQWVGSVLQRLSLRQHSRVLLTLYCLFWPAPVALELSALTGHDMTVLAIPLLSSGHC